MEADEINQKVGWFNVLKWRVNTYSAPFFSTRTNAILLERPLRNLGYSDINPEVIFAECCNSYNALGIELIKQMGSDSPHTHLMNYYFNNIAEYYREEVTRDERCVFKKGRNIYFVTFHMDVQSVIVTQNLLTPVHISFNLDIYYLSCIMVTLCK